jgi:hypothetical protein
MAADRRLGERRLLERVVVVVRVLWPMSPPVRVLLLVLEEGTSSEVFSQIGLGDLHGKGVPCRGEPAVSEVSVASPDAAVLAEELVVEGEVFPIEFRQQIVPGEFVVLPLLDPVVVRIERRAVVVLRNKVARLRVKV